MYVLPKMKFVAHDIQNSRSLKVLMSVASRTENQKSRSRLDLRHRLYLARSVCFISVWHLNTSAAISNIVYSVS